MQTDTTGHLDRIASIQSARNSLIELGVNPLVSLAPNVLDAVEEESHPVPASNAVVPEQGTRPSTLQEAVENVRLCGS